MSHIKNLLFTYQEINKMEIKEEGRVARGGRSEGMGMRSIV